MSATAKTRAGPAPDTALRRTEVLARIAWIQKAAIDELRAFWKTLGGAAPSNMPRRTMEQRLIYQVQEQAYGGLSPEAKARLDAIADADARQVPGKQAETPIPGTRYIRTWRGDRYEATAVEGGFEWKGRKFPSLSAVAKAITGQHWNGKLFFGVGKYGKREG